MSLMLDWFGVRKRATSLNLGHLVQQCARWFFMAYCQ